MTFAGSGYLTKWHRIWRSRFMGMLRGTHNHFLFFLPCRTGLIPWLLEWFYRTITIDPKHLDILKRLPPDAVTVYTVKYKSKFEFLFYHTRYRQEKMKAPELAFGVRPVMLQPLARLWRCVVAHLDFLVTRHEWLDPYKTGYWSQELLNGRAAVLPLVEKHGFYRRFVKAKADPLRFLIELQQSIDRPIYLIPHLMFFGKSPASPLPRLRDLFLGPEYRPGVLRHLLTLVRPPGKVFVEISQPLDLRQFIQSPEVAERSSEYQALTLRRRLLQQHNRHRQSITGPVIKSHEEIKESILGGERLRQYMAQHAESRKESIHDVRKEADGFLDEIAAKYNPFFVDWVSRPINWLLNIMFDGTVVDKDGLQRIKTMSLKGPLILIPCHKSHVDYLILSYMLYHNNMPAPHVAAGKNLSFWPMGPFARAGGAFFLRRSFRGAVLYARVFAEYIHKLLEDGFNIELFIEGGRSRSGKLLMPKLGLLTMLLNAYKNKACEDMIFAPVFIGYDQVLEETAFVHELEGGKKEPESVWQILRARRFLKRRYGKIYINFHEPISLKELLEKYQLSLTDMPQKVQNALCRDLGWRIINAIDQVSVVTAHALVAAAILNTPTKRFAVEDILQMVETYLSFLVSLKTRLADTLLLDPRRSCAQALENYVQRKIIEPAGGDKEGGYELPQYVLPTAKRLQLEYYKNNCLAHFVPAAFVSLAILEKDAFQFSAVDLHDRYRYLQDFFKYEFAFDTEKTAEHHVRKTVKSFIDEAILIPHATLPDTYQITSAGFRKLKLFASFLATYFESYLVVLNFIKKTPRAEINQKDRLKKIMALGKASFKKQEIELSESISKINYDNGLSFFTTHGVKGEENSEQIEAYEKIIRDFITLIRQ